MNTFYDTLKESFSVKYNEESIVFQKTVLLFEKREDKDKS